MQKSENEKIGKRIKQIRKEKEFTQESLAIAVDVNVSHISNLETGKVGVSLTLLIRICDALGVTIDYLLDNIYQNTDSAVENELLNTIKNLPKEKQETLLRIAKVL